jgi:adenylate cyclase
MSREDESSPSSRGAKRARRLAAILHADVHGYSRRIHDDEAGTLQVLTPSLELLRTLVEQHGGRAVGSRGDSLLAEFPSVVGAVQCAVEMQRELKEKNAALPEAKRLAFRMGISLGEIVIDGEQPHGDGINIAVRIEALAEPGGICISDIVYHQVKTKLPLQYRDLGEQQLKNIPEPVRVWRIIPDGSEGPQSTVQSAKVKGERQKPRKVSTSVFVSVLVFVVLGGLVTLWSFFPFSFRIPYSAFRTPEAQPPSLPLPDKPSIVVLPFTNMSGDPEQDYFNDGLIEDLTTDLSKISGLFVIARNSAFTYKGKAVKVQDVGRELGVRYVLEGSVRKSDTQVRINTQLIDTTTGGHLWSERYDRPLQEIFALQDEIRQKIVFALKVMLTEEEQKRFHQFPTNNLEAYDYFLRGREAGNRAQYEYRKEANGQARQMFEKAIELDPQYAAAYAWLGWIYYQGFFFRWDNDPVQSLERAFELAQRAVVLDDSLPFAHLVLGSVYLFQRQHAHAIAEIERAITLNPSNAANYLGLGTTLVFAGQPEEGIRLIEQGLRLDPRYPVRYLQNLTWAYRSAGQCEKAIAPLKQVLSITPAFIPSRVNLAVCYIELGREEEARAEAAEVLRLNPSFSVKDAWRKENQPFKDPTPILERLYAAARKAGLK